MFLTGKGIVFFCYSVSQCSGQGEKVTAVSKMHLQLHSSNNNNNDNNNNNKNNKNNNDNNNSEAASDMNNKHHVRYVLWEY